MNRFRDRLFAALAGRTRALPILGRLAARAGDSWEKTIRQFTKFFLIGGFNTLLDYVLYWSLTRHFDFWGRHIVLATTLTYVIGTLSSYLLNSFWTFRQTSVSWGRAAIFGFVALSSLLLNSFIVFILTSIGLYDIFAKMVATGMVLIWNFTMQKKVTFRSL
ncbi:hypothetical protein A3C96_00065 [Candidatus Uhrbacteria bacterium RIFCSPHIGHO2_02_FULL_60_10]|uniref:GtrA/DPMS transmembrane domain-containing protein n=1 Tax=Candidatus Uhrbacteria bacterium RIFCSPHIGHO2_02_FULL_60_10 TaxID=1802392 RepID=A0A1F7U9P6_9BACT|nr:MAG: hypothetical protein A3C96_00065 [Candidatus Uhrbacteria bacterium RIFCSPHIGHO2_02_FULL_60_10]